MTGVRQARQAGTSKRQRPRSAATGELEVRYAVGGRVYHILIHDFPDAGVSVHNADLSPRARTEGPARTIPR